MPVWRFKTLEDAERALWLPTGDPRIPGRLRSLWALSRRLVPSLPFRGVRRYRSIEEAQADREAWVQARVDRIRRERS